MRKDGQQGSGPSVQFVWDKPGGAASRGPAGRRRVLRRRALLIGSGTLVLAVGAAYGADALSAQQHHASAGVAAMTLPGSLLPAQGEFPTLPTRPTRPSPHPSASQSATPAKYHTAPATHGNTAAAQVLTSVAAPAGSSAAAPASSSAPAPAPAPAEGPVPAPVGDWLLNQTVGNTAVDSTGAHDGTAEDGWWAGGDGCLLNGTDSQIYTNGPVLSTGRGHSFTVSAWVYMSALPASGQNATAVSQDGGEDSGFYLQYVQSAGRWAFSRVSNDTANPTAYQALSESGPALSTWTHLVGVYDAADDTQYLYVNGVPQGTATDSTPFSANGDLAFGRDEHDGQDADWLTGAIKQVEVFDAALGPTQVSELS